MGRGNNSNHKAILALDFIRAHGLLYDPRSDLLVTLWEDQATMESLPNNGMARRIAGDSSPDENNEPEILLSHTYVYIKELATGSRFDPSGTWVQLDILGEQECITLCSVTADTAEEAKELRKVQEEIPLTYLP